MGHLLILLYVFNANGVVLMLSGWKSLCFAISFKDVSLDYGLGFVL